jgi:hypothetical protein
MQSVANVHRGPRGAWAAVAAGLLMACARETPPTHEALPVPDVTPVHVGGVQQVGQYGRLGVSAGPYALDSLNRQLSGRELACPEVVVRDFSGSEIAFVPSARVIEPFRQRLLAFERVVAEVARSVYGRAPRKILVAASYGCRSVSGQNRRLSEHALGNAIDVRGFEFAPLYTALHDRSETALTLAGAFEVSVARDWKAAGDPVRASHARFLARLTDELIARGIFRTLLGPAHPDHKDHFHFDVSPWAYVDL